MAGQQNERDESNGFDAGNAKGDHATLHGLIHELKTMYWQAAKREVCNMLLFYRMELKDIFPEKTAYEGALEDLKMKQFERLFMLWCTCFN
jgi:hypothetical protein